MILDFVHDIATCARYTVYDSDTGRCMDLEPIVFIDTDRGFYDAYEMAGSMVAQDQKGRAIVKRIHKRLAVFTRLEYLKEPE